MRCPACGRALSRVTVEGIALDVCRGGCGGIWFDRYELMKVDESRESAGEKLLDIEREPALAVNHDERRSCPKCAGVVMMRHFSSVKRRVTVDECPNCGGFWLDAGELASIRSEFETQEERDRAAAQYFAEVFDTELAAARAESMQDLGSARKVAHILRFICPSYYVPGKQKWGRFEGFRHQISGFAGRGGSFAYGSAPGLIARLLRTILVEVLCEGTRGAVHRRVSWRLSSGRG